MDEIVYESDFDLSYIKKVKLFIIYETLEDCLGEIFSGINSGKPSLTEGVDSINLLSPLNNLKYNNIKFEIKMKGKNDKEKIDHLYSIIEKQNKDIQNLYSLIEKQNEDIQYLKNQITFIQNNYQRINRSIFST